MESFETVRIYPANIFVTAPAALQTAIKLIQDDMVDQVEYFKEIEKVADKKSMTVSKLIRSYIKDGMHNDEDFRKDDKGFNIG